MDCHILPGGSDIHKQHTCKSTLAGNITQERIHIHSIYESTSGVEIDTEVIFPSFLRSMQRRLLAVADWKAVAVSLQRSLESSISSVFPSVAFKAYGTPRMPAGFYVYSYEHYGEPEAWMQPLKIGAYLTFDWLSPSIYSGGSVVSNSTSPSSNSTSPPPTANAVIVVVTFSAQFFNASAANLTATGLGFKYVNAVASAAGNSLATPPFPSRACPPG